MNPSYIDVALFDRNVLAIKGRTHGFYHDVSAILCLCAFSGLARDLARFACPVWSDAHSLGMDYGRLFSIKLNARLPSV